MDLIEHQITPMGALNLCWVDEDGGRVRACRSPGEDLADLPDDVREEIAAVWTPEFVDAWRAEHGIGQPVSLEDLKAAACARARALRWENHITVHFNGVEFVSDDTAATRLVAAISARQIAQAMGLEPETATAAWEAKNGAMIPMTLNDQRGLLLAGVAKTQAAFDRQAELIAEINAAETVEALEAIDLSTGWPA